MLAHAPRLIKEGRHAADGLVRSHRSGGTPWLTRDGLPTATGDRDAWVAPLEYGHHSRQSADAFDIVAQGEGREADELRADQDSSPHGKGRGHFRRRRDTEKWAAEEGDCPIVPRLSWDVNLPRVQHVSTPWTFSATTVTVPQGLCSSHPYLRTPRSTNFGYSIFL